MSLKNYIPLAAIFLFCMAACKKSGVTNNDPKTSKDTDVYISGFSSKGGTYWKNGTPIYLPGSFGDNNASIAVNGSDVYVVGFSLSNGTIGTYIATIWKNGIATKLNEGADYSEIDNIKLGNIVVNGTDVYTVGFENGSGIGGQSDRYVAMYWKNNVPVQLTDGSADAYAYAIAVNGNDVYVVGSMNGNAVYWKNGTPVNLTNGTYGTYSISSIAVANAILINGSDVYIAGNSIAANGNTVATYWKNGVAVNLTDGSTNSAIMAIAVNNSDVYVAGYISNPVSNPGGNTVATLLEKWYSY